MEELNYPLVSVVMIAYNQEDYIAQAVEGVLNQEYNGEIELILANDRSTDATDEIVQKMIQNHANGSWVKYTNHAVNKGMFENITWALSQVTANYVALCEGDDFWTDPLKLQKQIDFLEANQDYAMCFHSAKTENFSKEYKKEFHPIENRAYNIHEIYFSWMVPTASIVFKSEIIPSVLAKFKDPRVFNWDIILILTCFNFGKIRGVADYMSVYHFQDNGLSIVRMRQNMLAYSKKNLQHHKFIQEEFNTIEPEYFATKFFHIHMDMATIYYSKRSIKCIPHFFKGVYYRPAVIWNGLKKVF